MINQNQSPNLVNKQLKTAQKNLDAKRVSLSKATGKSQISRLRLEIAELERRITEYQEFLRSKQ
jgi:hypothetical protein